MNDVMARMDQKANLFNTREIKSMYFQEEWFLDTAEPFIFEKNVKQWFPVRYYQKDSMNMMKLVFMAKGGNPNTLLAKNVIYEFDLQDTLIPENTKNIDASKLTKLLFGKLKGKEIACDPMNVNKFLNAKEIETRMGAGSDTILIDDPETGVTEQQIIKVAADYSSIRSLIFVENWYYDTKTYAIKKVVKGIGPVRHYVKPCSGDEPGEQMKTVVFMMYFGDEKINIFN
jgi:hypothetical protein